MSLSTGHALKHAILLVSALSVFAPNASATCVEQELSQVKIKAAVLAAALADRYGYEVDHVSPSCARFGETYRFDYQINVTGHDYVFFVVGSEYARRIDADVWDSSGRRRGGAYEEAVPVIETQVWDSGVFTVRYQVIGVSGRYSDAMVAVVVMKRPR